MSGRALRIAIRHDWLPVECIAALPPRLRRRALSVSYQSGRFSVNQIRALMEMPA